MSNTDNKNGILNINHIGINVTDMDTAVKFYTEVLGFEKRGEAIKNGGDLVQFISLPGGETTLELIKYPDGKEKPGYDVTSIGIYRHIAYGVKDKNTLLDIWETLKKAKEEDFPTLDLTTPPMHLPDLGIHVVLFKDPNGIEVEFCCKA